MLQSYYVTHAAIKLHFCYVTQVLHCTAISLHTFYVKLLHTTAITLHLYIRCSVLNVSNEDCLISRETIYTEFCVSISYKL